jgi:hypothetical protein
MKTKSALQQRFAKTYGINTTGPIPTTAMIVTITLTFSGKQQAELPESIDIVLIIHGKN